MNKTYSVYILASASRTLYTGFTSDLRGRVFQHANSFHPGAFTSHYKVHKLVYFENYSDVHSAIDREKQIKKYRREKKIALIEKDNPEWADIYDAL